MIESIYLILNCIKHTKNSTIYLFLNKIAQKAQKKFIFTYL